VLCEQLQEIERLGSICDALVKRVKELSRFSPGINAPQMKSHPAFSSSIKLIKETNGSGNVNLPPCLEKPE